MRDLSSDIADLIVESGSIPDPPQDVADVAKLHALIDAMAETGWDGPPVVVDGPDALTGSHRIAAYVWLSNNEGVDFDLPRVEIADLCARYGAVPWDDHLRHWQELLPGLNARPWKDAAITIADELPRNVVDYLGLDMH